MELTFQQSMCPCLKTLVGQVENQEQTQEVRLSDGMPDVGRVLGCWGQPLVRGKEWRADSVMISGGVMVWALYAPEDGTQPRCVDAWIPFQFKWDLPQTQRDGTIITNVSLKNIDCRSISARKLMIRATVSINAQAMELQDVELYQPADVPEDVQLLRVSYPVDVPQEAGEKAFMLEESVALGLPEQSGKIIGCEMRCSINDQKVLADKVVFRGMCWLHLVYQNADGEIQTKEHELAFSQFAELDHSFGNNAQCTVTMLPTGLELDINDEGYVQIKCGLAAQYVIYDRLLLELVEDAYSTARQVTPMVQELRLPTRLDCDRQNLSYSEMISMSASKIVDVSACWEQPVVRPAERGAQAQIAAQYQVLYTDENGALQSANARGEELWQMESDPSNDIVLSIDFQFPHGELAGEGVNVTGQMLTQATVMGTRPMPMVTKLQIGDTLSAEPNRPSLVLRKTGNERLWDIAKQYGSTVQAIQQANGLQDQPMQDQMLLIPVP